MTGQKFAVHSPGFAKNNGLVKSPKSVTPAKAGVQNPLK